MTIIEERLPYIAKLRLGSGIHQPPSNGLVEACVMEAVSYVAGEPWSDHPECASPVLTSFLIGWNDALPDDDRQMLKPYIPRLVGTRTGAEDESTRAWMLTDWLARECAPAWLRQAGLTKQAKQLESLAPLVDTASAQLAQPSLDAAKKDANAVRDAAWAAVRAAVRDAVWDAAWAAVRAAVRDAAWDAAWAAVRDAVRDAAWAAVRDAVWDAVWDAVRAAVWDAVRAAVWDAAWDAAREHTAYDQQYSAAYAAAKPLIEKRFAPTVAGLQQSALLLLDRLIEVGR